MVESNRLREVGGIGPAWSQHERAGAEGRLGLAGLQAGLADRRGLLIAGDAADRDRRTEQGRLAELTGAIDDLRQRRARGAEQVDQPVVPLAAADRHQRGAAGIGRVGDVQSAGQLPDQPALDRAHRQPAAGLLQLRPVGHRPADLGARKIGIEQQPGLGLHHWLMPRLAQVAAHRGGAPVLPDDRGRQRFAGLAVPEHDRLALVGDADRGDPLRPAAALDRRTRHREGLVPDFRRVVLDPAAFRIMLDQFGGFARKTCPVGREQHRPGGSGALVDNQDQLAHAIRLAGITSEGNAARLSAKSVA